MKDKNSHRKNKHTFYCDLNNAEYSMIRRLKSHCNLNVSNRELLTDLIKLSSYCADTGDVKAEELPNWTREFFDFDDQ